MKKLFVLIGIFTLAIFIGCIPQETKDDLIEISFTTNEEDIQPLREDILDTISTVTFK